MAGSATADGSPSEATAAGQPSLSAALSAAVLAALPTADPADVDDGVLGFDALSSKLNRAVHFGDLLPLRGRLEEEIRCIDAKKEKI